MNFQKKYNSLTQVEQELMQILSIMYEPSNKTSIVKCVQKCGLKINKKQATSYNLSPILEKLREEKLIEFSGNLLQITKAFIEKITLTASKQDYFSKYIDAIQKTLPVKSPYYGEKPFSFKRSIREIRIALYTHNEEYYNRQIELTLYFFPNECRNFNVYTELCNNPFDSVWFSKLPMTIQSTALNVIIYDSIEKLNPIDEQIKLLEEYVKLSKSQHINDFRDLLVICHVFQGNLREALLVAQQYENKPEGVASIAWIKFLQGHNDTSLNLFETALKMHRKIAKKRKSYFYHLSGLFYILAMLKTRDMSYFPKIAEIFDIIESAGNDFLPSYFKLEELVLIQQNQLESPESVCKNNINNINSLEAYFSFLVIYWTFSSKLEKKQKELQTYFNKADKNGYKWLAMEFANLLYKINPKEEKYKSYASNIHKKNKITSLLPIIEKEEEWQRSLKALTHLNQASDKKNNQPKKSRLVWLVDFNKNSCSFSPKEQMLGASGKWSKGKPIALKRFKYEGIECMTPQDQKIRSAIEEKTYRTYGYYQETCYEFDRNQTLLAMVGHPLLFLESSPGVCIELVKQSPEIVVEQQDNGYEIKFSHDISEKKLNLIKETSTRFKIIEITDEHRKIAATLGSKTLKVPKQAKNYLMSAISNISSMVTVHSDIGGQNQSIPKIKADERIYIHLLPIGNGLKLEMFVKPFKSDPPYFKPGKGGENIIAEIQSKKMQTKRNLTRELENQKQIIANCPSLSGILDEYLFEQAEDCLEILSDLEQSKKKVVIEWPEGKKFRITHYADFDKMSLKIKKENDWFGLSGKLKLDKNLVLDMQQLLELVENTPSRFVQLEDGKFLALTKKFKNQLQDIKSFSQKNKNGRKFHALQAIAMQGFSDNIKNLNVDQHWQEHVNKIKESQNLQPTIPSTMQVDLRDYQKEGYDWIARLANWGVGACLADDMGLGKTIQALAIILERCQSGPALVVAPASVCANWLNEANKFTPTLNGIFFNNNRENSLNDLKPFDVLVVSYGLLQNEGEKLSKIKFSTIILDEAQAIKNTLTKRSKAAMELQADFKMITTGTPIENHLGELWNLFNFINPGLLGSREHFNEQFAIPIEKNQDSNTKKRLKKLIQPFILRRKKNQVLEELPQKTEITLSVEMTNEETAFYEALRQKALEKIENLDGPTGAKHLKILAEIMKLRQACCHSQLILPESNIESSKLNLLSNVIDELRENNHKALIFSQFIGHLDLIRELIKKKGISYQYLDGSTPIQERQKRVDAFQAGQGDLFLISLKAGGVGLNLTAANYVIHMDPWWNPAVEDQASDRAHRIGQKNPVTIYRLVTKNTIEEKIVNLHKEKRDLADSLLEGSEKSGKLSASELIGLIKS